MERLPVSRSERSVIYRDLLQSRSKSSTPFVTSSRGPHIHPDGGLRLPYGLLRNRPGPGLRSVSGSRAFVLATEERRPLRRLSCHRPYAECFGQARVGSAASVSWPLFRALRIGHTFSKLTGPNARIHVVCEDADLP